MTNTLTLNGTIRANGNAYGSGGGTGGSVWLSADTFAGTGSVEATTPDVSGGNNRGPGGGRISLVYNTSTFSGTVDAAGGRQGTAGYYGDGQGAIHLARVRQLVCSNLVTSRTSNDWTPGANRSVASRLLPRLAGGV